MIFNKRGLKLSAGVIPAVIFFIILCAIPSYSGKAKPVKVLKTEIPGESDYKADALYDYSKVDRYALSASSLDEQSIDSLSKYLSKAGAGERDKARAIYIWIAEHIVYDFEALKARKISDQSATVILKTRIGVCQGFANLYHELAVKMNLADEVLIGYSKGYGYRPGDKFTDTDHAWNAVRVDGKWRLIDVTWGAGSIDAKTGKVVKTDPGFWFFAKPECMIYTHLPEKSEWALLGRTVTLVEFENMACLEQSFFENGFDESVLNARTFVIKTPGTFTISLKGSRVEIGAELIDSSGVYIQEYNAFPFDEIDSVKKKVFVTCKNSADTATVDVNIPDSGTYELRLLSVKRNKDGAAIFGILSYRVVVTSGNTTVSEDITKPVMTYDEFGKLGFSISGLSHKNYGIKTDRDIKLEFAGGRDVEMLSVIEHDGTEYKDLTFIQSNEGKFSVSCAFPSDGIFNLRIFAKRKGNSGEFGGIAAYKFFVSGVPKNERCGFPVIMGDYIDKGARLITPMTGYLKMNSTVEFKIEVPGAIEVLAGSGRQQIKLKKTTGDIYEGKLKISGKDISIGALFKKGEGYPMLVKYKVY